MTEPTQAENGHQERKARVKFGPAPTQSMPHEWAEAALRWLYDNNKSQFGKALSHAAGVEIPTTGRPKATQ